MSDVLRSWRYSAENASGDVISGQLDAKDDASVVAQLRSRKLIPISIEPQRRARLSWFSIGGKKSSLSLVDLVAVLKRMSELLNAGLPLPRVLSLCLRHAQNSNEIKLFNHLDQEIRAGRSLSDALSTSETKTPPLVSAIIRAGENLGALPRQLEKLCTHYSERLRLRREIINQLVYPAALGVLIVLTLVFLSFFVLPQFEVIFADAGAPPPWETRAALAGGAFVRNYILYAPGAALAVIFLWRALKERLSPIIDKTALEAPLIGPIRRDAEIGRYTRTLSTLLGGGMSLSDAMPLAAETVESAQLKSALLKIEDAVRAGGALSGSIAKFANPSPEITSFIEVGEESGELAAMAGEAARFAEERTQRAIKKTMALLGPVLTAIMGLLTAGVIAAVMSGVLSLNDAVL